MKEVVIISAVRTPVGRYMGALKTVEAYDLGALVLDQAVSKINLLPEQKKIEGLGGNMRLGGRDVEIKPDTLASQLFNKAKSVRMRFRHRYEVDPRYIDQLEAAGLIFSGKAPDQPIMQILELPSHPYFMGTQAHPCLTSRPLKPHPMFMGLVDAAMKKRYPNEKFGDIAKILKKLS